ncbi:hypothetical protein JD844_016446 [Phrynosoma platyrhinos]|uniref:Piezo TM1-24 domain-containing protein n=1 Tax=Phrynosoma platyrhinos TaxID=52577 RepID=A0ABQ7SKL7_PHRPL|nr:hypothetical protein JD844_016446 [Phrynosoma platyrhinos]
MHNDVWKANICVKEADPGNGIRIFVPDIGMFIASLTIWLICRKIVKKAAQEDAGLCNAQFESEYVSEAERIEAEDALICEDLDDGCGEEEFEETTKLKLLRRIASVASKMKEIIGNIITTAGKVVVTILLGTTGDFYARLFGVTSVIQTNCSSTWKIITNQQLSWYHHTSPILLLLLYYTLATLIRLWLHEPIVQHVPDEDKSGNKEEETDCSPNQMTAERRRSLWYTSRYPTDERKLLSMTQDEHKPSDILLVTVNGTPVDYQSIHPLRPIENGPANTDIYSRPHYKWDPTVDDLEMKDDEEEENQEEAEEEENIEEEKNSKVHAMVTVFHFIMKQSYVCALIAMMVG